MNDLRLTYDMCDEDGDVFGINISKALSVKLDVGTYWKLMHAS